MVLVVRLYGIINLVLGEVHVATLVLCTASPEQTSFLNTSTKNKEKQCGFFG
jgi:hypothetical protein